MLQAIVGAALLLLSFGAEQAGAIQVWQSVGDIPSAVPAGCRDALIYNITCANDLVTAQDAMNGVALVGVTAQTYCTQQCSESLQTFQKNIHASCGTNEYELYVNSTTKQSPAVVSDGLKWAYDLVCIQDSYVLSIRPQSYTHDPGEDIELTKRQQLWILSSRSLQPHQGRLLRLHIEIRRRDDEL